MLLIYLFGTFGYSLKYKLLDGFIVGPGRTVFLMLYFVVLLLPCIKVHK